MKKNCKILTLLFCIVILTGCGAYTKYNPQKSFAYNTVRASGLPSFYVKDNERPTGISGISPEGMVTVGSVVTGMASPATLFLPGGPWLSANTAKFNRIFGWIEAKTQQEAKKKFKDLVLSWLKILDKNAQIIKVDRSFLFYNSPNILKRLNEGKLKADYDPALLVHLSNKKLMPEKPTLPSIDFIVFGKKTLIPEWVSSGNKMGFMCSITMGVVKSIPENVILNHPYFFYYSAPTKEKAPYLFSWEGKKYYFVKPNNK